MAVLMNIAKIAVNRESALGSSQPVILTSIKEVLEFKDGKPTGKILGFMYEVACPCIQFDKREVKVFNEPAIITQEEIDRRNFSGKYVWTTFEGFDGRLFQNYKTKDNYVTCTATKVVLATQKEG